MTTARRGPGRPRDPAFDQLILDAALDVYGERGWSGLTMDEIARRAGVGKAALYLRWPSKEELLVEAFSAGSPRFAPEDADLSPRELLLAIGSQMRHQYAGRFGRALVRLALDADQVPDLYRRASVRFYKELEFGIKVLDGADLTADAGSGLPSDTGAVTLLEALGGAILMRTLFTARWDNPQAADASDEFVAGIVGLIAPRERSTSRGVPS